MTTQTPIRLASTLLALLCGAGVASASANFFPPRSAADFRPSANQQTISYAATHDNFGKFAVMNTSASTVLPVSSSLGHGGGGTVGFNIFGFVEAGFSVPCTIYVLPENGNPQVGARQGAEIWGVRADH